ncbi:MFS transporter [Paenibacillus hemerocallicola]|uniref:MFS transporter n=1 Tax=Paenibacillus hemerocallicola TaxID=1172614 RepID=A0A5C4T5B8_9BACL|nr:MFS transporter [Paenibacillus hemerocallicola]TNJ63955.1 MFS transporter [Paenibacillus hemerocallicola]
MKLSQSQSFVRFWAASTTSYFGTYITSLSLQVLIVANLQGGAADVGWMNASRWLPYVVLGLVAGVMIDRAQRKYVLVLTDLGRGILMALIGLTDLFGTLQMGWLMVMMMGFGILSIFHDAAYQSFVPQLVPKDMLTRANARLEQSAAVAESSGPALAGGLVAWVGAPFTVLVNAAAYGMSGAWMASIQHASKVEAPAGSVRTQVKEGLRWVYRHPYLRSLALNTHAWFFFHSMTGAVLVTFALVELGFNESKVGFALAAAGIGAVAGSFLSTMVGQRLGVGLAMTFSRILYVPALFLIAVAPSVDSFHSPVFPMFVVMSGQFLYGFAMGVEGPLEMGYRQTVTPLSLQGRMNATMRSINRSMIVIGAPLGGLIADTFGFRTSLTLAVAGLAFCAIWFWLSPMRHAKLDENQIEGV